jgi:hypothetical protein
MRCLSTCVRPLSMAQVNIGHSGGPGYRPHYGDFRWINNSVFWVYYLQLHDQDDI